MKLLELNREISVENQDTTITLKFQIVPYFVPVGRDISRILKSVHIAPHNLTFTVTGTAHLKPGDTYDKELGEKIAEAKAMRKAFYKLTLVLSYIREYMTDMLLDNEYKYLGALRNEAHYFNTLVYGEKPSS